MEILIRKAFEKLEECYVTQYCYASWRVPRTGIGHNGASRPTYELTVYVIDNSESRRSRLNGYTW